MTNFLQANLNRARAAQALLSQMMYEHKADVAIISEPNKIPDNDSWYGSTDNTCCLLLSKDVEVMNSGQGEGYVWVDFLSYRVYSCYFSPSKKHSLENYREYLSYLSDSIRQGPSEVIVAGDFNAHSPSWGSPSMCAKGDALTDMANSLGLIVINQGQAPTFERRGQESHIDVTFASPSVSRKIGDWQVLEEDIASDHHPIFFSTQMIAQPANTRSAGWSWRRMDELKLAAYLQNYAQTGGQATFDADGLDKFLEAACDSCMPRRCAKTQKKAVHWWTEDIANLRKTIFKARRTYQKACKRRGRDLCQQEHQNAREASKALRLEIRRSQERCWADLCRQVDNDPWGLPFKLVTKKLIGRRPIPGIRLPGRLDLIVDHLFPRSKPPAYPTVTLQVPEECLFTLEELKDAGRCLPKGKAPGPDGVPDAVLRVIVQVRPDLLLPTFNKCLKTGTFLDRWKTATLVLLCKGTKPLDQPSSYRPLCLINSTGKLFERLLSPYNAAPTPTARWHFEATIRFHESEIHHPSDRASNEDCGPCWQRTTIQQKTMCSDFDGRSECV